VVLVRGARQLVTLRGEARPRQGAEMSSLGIIQDGALLIVDGIIREVGPGRRVERLAEARGAEEVDATGKVVMPGFVDCLTRPLHPMAAPETFEWRCSQGQAEPTAAELNSSSSLKTHSAQRLEAEVRRNLKQFLRQGTLAIAASPGWDADVRTTLKGLRVLHELAAGAVRVSPVVALGAGSAPDLLERMSRAKFNGLVSVDGRQAEARGFALRARKLGLPVRVRSDVELAVECRASLLIGGDAVGHVSALRDAGVVCGAYPSVDRLSGGHRAPLRATIDAGLAVALASGFGVEGNAMSNLAMVMSLACLESRLSPAEALTAVTINAAFAINMAHLVGSLAPGKAADLLFMDAGDYREIAMQPGTNLVQSIMLRGHCAPASPTRRPVASEPRRTAAAPSTSRVS
jgi:imidazolonepropionase